MTKYIKLEQFESLLATLEERDSWEYWAPEYEKQDKKLKNSIEFIRRNAKTKDELPDNHYQILKIRVKESE